MERKVADILVSKLNTHGIIFVSDVYANDIRDNGDYSAAIQSGIKHEISKYSPYSLALVVGESVYLTVVKRKLDLSGGGVAVLSYGTCDVDYIGNYPTELTLLENETVLFKESVQFSTLIRQLYYGSANKEEFGDVVQKYLHLSNPTFEVKGNELFFEDAEKLSNCIFSERNDQVEMPIFNIIEDDLIVQDFKSSGNGDLIEERGSHYRFVTQRGRFLDIINVNRKDGETALGVDLIYYMREFRSVVMLQYKRITSGVYYTVSDKKYEKEVTRMNELRNYFQRRTIEDSGMRHKEFRLSDCPFYFKLCPDASVTTNRFVTGACIHLDFWNSLMESEMCKTAKGNFKLGYDELAGRHLTSMEFINFTKRGLLGGYLASIGELGKLIKSLKADRHMVLAAIASPAMGYTDQ